LRIARELLQPVGEIAGLACFDEEAVLAVAHDIRDSADACGHDRAFGRERFDRTDRSSLAAGRQDERIECGIEGSDLLLVAEEEDLTHDPELVGPPLELNTV